VSSDERLALVAKALADLGLRALAMGGHAVRFYGVDRSTVDFDFCLALDPGEWGDLAVTLARSTLLAGPRFREGPSWRPGAFRRFVIGELPDGREERLELWRSNPISLAYLLPAAARAGAAESSRAVTALGGLAPPLPDVAPGSARHLALVEAVRRLYRREAMLADRMDKEGEASPTG
jgi:hypothetical protein